MNFHRFLIGILLVSVCSVTQFAWADRYPVILHGKVMMDDGSPPPIPVEVERVCSDLYGSMPGVLTDKKGEYIWRMEIDPLETRNCTIRASHAGYSSTSVEVSGVDTTHTTLDLPPIKIHAAAADPYIINFSDKGISGKAMSDWKAAIKALDAQNLSEVASHLEAVTAASGKAAQAWHALGVVDERLNKQTEARAAYEHAIAADAKLLPAYVTLVRLCVKTKDWNCASMTAQSLVKADSKHVYLEAYVHQAVAEYELKDLNAAQQSVEEAIQLDSKNTVPRAHYVLGRILEAKGEMAGAKEHMTMYLKLEPAPQDVEQVRAHINDLGKEGASGPDPDLEQL